MDCCHARLRLGYDKYTVRFRNNMVSVWPQINETARTYFNENLNTSRAKEVPRDRQSGERPMFSLSEEAGDSFLTRKTTTGRWFFSDSKREKIRKEGFWEFRRDSTHLKSCVLTVICQGFLCREGFRRRNSESEMLQCQCLTAHAAKPKPIQEKGSSKWVFVVVVVIVLLLTLKCGDATLWTPRKRTTLSLDDYTPVKTYSWCDFSLKILHNELLRHCSIFW